MSYNKKPDSKEDRPKDPKPEKSREKGQHKSCKDGSDSDNKDRDKAASKHKKHHCSPSPVRHHHSTGQKDSTIPVSALFTDAQDTTKPLVAAKPFSSVPGSSAPEPHSQTLAKPSTSHGGSITADGSSLTGQHFSSYSTGAEAYPQAQEQYRESFPLSFTGPPEADDIPLSKTPESEENIESPPDKQEIAEELNYRETVGSVRSFMGWDHIPTFESDLSEPDKSNNPWKGKNPKRPSRISVAMPPDDWLCQKLERLNCTVAEGYPSKKPRFCRFEEGPVC